MNRIIRRTAIAIVLAVTQNGYAEFSDDQWNRMGKAGRRAELEASEQRLIEADRQNDAARIEYLNAVAKFIETKYRTSPSETKKFVDEIVMIGQFSLSKAMQEARIAPSNINNISGIM
jgi:uncharacterized protein YfkK (UPF0435 family)